MTQRIDNAWDAVARLDIFDGAIDQMIGGLPHADWKRAWRKFGLLGLIGEFLATLFSLNSHQFHFARGADWSGIEVEGLLRRYHIPIWGRWFSRETLMFRVKKRQARWAEYVMLRAGVPLVSHPVDPRNQARASRRPGVPKPWRGRRSGTLFDRVLQILRFSG